MNTSFRIDHIVILVDDLAIAIEDYRTLGFTVVPGGQHEKWGSHNALISLGDGVYVELIAFGNRSPSPDQRTGKEVCAEQLREAGRSVVESRVLAWQGPAEGLIDFALLPDNVGAAIAWARENGLQVEGPFSGGRMRPDGQAVRWDLGIPGTFDVPFLCGDVTDRSCRVPAGDAVKHANGAGGVDQMTIAVTDLDASVMRYKALLGTAPQPVGSNLPDTQTATLVIGSVRIMLAMPTSTRSPLWPALSSRGQGPVRLDLRTADYSKLGLVDPALAHGAEISLVGRDNRSMGV